MFLAIMGFAIFANLTYYREF